MINFILMYLFLEDDNCLANDTSFWENQEQIFNGLQDKNINNDDNAIEKPREKRFGLVISYNYYISILCCLYVDTMIILSHIGPVHDFSQ